jgi:hypothetical protein
MKEQTAVEWLHNQLHLNISLYQDEWQIIEGLMEQAKEREKEQIIKAYNTSFLLRDKPYSTAENYYKQTYESKTNI